MAFIIKKRWKYFELVPNTRKDGKHQREQLYYMGKILYIPEDIVCKFKISSENIQRLKFKYNTLKIWKNYQSI